MPQFQITTQAPLIAFISIFLMLGGILLLLFGFGIIQSGEGKDIIFRIKSGWQTSLIGAIGIGLGISGIFWSNSTPASPSISPTPTMVVAEVIADNSPQQSEPTRTPAIATNTPRPTPTLKPTSTPSPMAMENIDILIGTWHGIERVTWEDESQADWEGDVVITIMNSCRIGSDCGMIDFPTVPCSAKLLLKTIQDDILEFQRRDVTGEGCVVDAQDILQPLADGTLSYIGRGDNWEGIAVLQRQ